MKIQFKDLPLGDLFTMIEGASRYYRKVGAGRAVHANPPPGYRSDVFVALELSVFRVEPGQLTELAEPTPSPAREEPLYLFTLIDLEEQKKGRAGYIVYTGTTAELSVYLGYEELTVLINSLPITPADIQPLTRAGYSSLTDVIARRSH